MKNMKKLLQKAMVFTLSAAMLVGTPMTASAAELVDLYSISDGTGTVDEGNNPNTGTITNTDTNTGFLIENNKVSIVGIALDRQTVDAEVGVKETLKATVVLDGKIYAEGDIENRQHNLVAQKGDDITDLVVEAMSDKIHWELMYIDADGNVREDVGDPAEKVGIALTEEEKATNRSVVILTPYHGTKVGEEVTVRATIDASYYFDPTKTSETWEERLKEDKIDVESDAFYTADAKVSVKECTDVLTWTDGDKDEDEDWTTATSEIIVKHTLDLMPSLVRDPATANDTITWTSDAAKVATVSKDGVVTAKKIGTATITAVSEHGAVATRKITVIDGTKASKVVITESWSGNNLEIADGNKTITVETYAKVNVAKDTDGKPMIADSASELDVSKKGDNVQKNAEVKNGQFYVTTDGVVAEMKVTDVITWSSNKTAFATVTPVGSQIGGGTATVTPVGVGKATITAKATNGAKATKVANVQATLTELKIDGVEDGDTVYSGQSIQLTAEKTPAQNKDAVKWSVTKEDDTKTTNASINAKGVLTIKNQVANGEKIKVTLAHNKKGTTVDAATVTLTVKQSSIDGITVVEGTDTGATPIAQVGLNDKGKIAQLVKAGTSNINVSLKKTYTAKVDGDDLGATLLTWKTNKPKVVSVSSSGKSAEITALAPGKATITVSGVRTVTDAKGKVKASVISTKFTVQVKQPVTTLTMNKPTVTLAEKIHKTKGTQDQKVSLKVTFGPKNADKSQKVIDSWTVQKVGEDSKTLMTGKVGKEKKVTSASVSVNLTKPEAGDVYKITAKSITGATATSIVTITAPTTGVQILKKNGTEVNKKGEELAVGGKLGIKAQINVGTKDVPDWVDAGSESAKTKNAEDVTYTVNKKGIVTIDKDGNIYAIKKGTVTITAKTATGKKATLKVKVN